MRKRSPSCFETIAIRGRSRASPCRRPEAAATLVWRYVTPSARETLRKICQHVQDSRRRRVDRELILSSWSTINRARVPTRHLSLPNLLQPPPWTFGPCRLTAFAVSRLFFCEIARLPRLEPRSDQGAPSSTMHVVSIKSRAASGANAPYRRVPPRPRVFIIDRPKACLLATILAVLALVAVGALANNFLSAPRRLACEVPAAVAPQQ
jgi:hypothetical protein